MMAVMTWVTASKKKNLDATEVLTSITTEAVMTASNATMLRPRMTFKMMYPGPAHDFSESPMVKDRLLVVSCVVSTVLSRRRWNLDATLSSC